MLHQAELVQDVGVARAQGVRGAHIEVGVRQVVAAVAAKAHAEPAVGKLVVDAERLAVGGNGGVELATLAREIAALHVLERLRAARPRLDGALAAARRGKELVEKPRQQGRGVSAPVSSLTKRSMSRRAPEAGGMPYSSARTKSAS